MLILCVAYTTLAGVILLPFLRPGYILTLDMVFTPHLRMPETLNNSYLFYAFLHLLNYVVPSQIIQKLLLFTIFILAGVGMHRLTQQLAKDDAPAYRAAGAYAAGILYVINPFTYDRLMAGQYGILLGYALLPFFVRALLRFLDEPAKMSSLVVGAWAIGISIVSIHALGLMVVLGGVGGVITLLKYRSRAFSKRLVRYGVLGAGLFLLLSSYWLVPLALGKGSTATQLAQFGSNDTAAFATVGGGTIGKVSNVVRLQGFWAETRNQYPLPQDGIRAWGLLALLLWVVVGIGSVHAWRTGHRFMVAFFGTHLVLGIALAVGIFNQTIISHVPLFGGFREPQKFVGLIVLGYCVGVGFGAPVLLRAIEKHTTKVVARAALGIVLLFPALFTSTMLWGCRGHLTPRSYPAEWFTVNTLLDQDKSSFQSLFLPWHLYTYYDFTERIIASPAPAFFDKPMIVSDDPEFNGAAPAKTTATKQQLRHILPVAAERSDLAKQLVSLNIKYIVLTHDNDYLDYAYLAQQRDLTRMYSSPTITLFRNQSWKAQP
jgi:hypothetical protein